MASLGLRPYFARRASSPWAWMSGVVSFGKKGMFYDFIRYGGYFAFSSWRLTGGLQDNLLLLYLPSNGFSKQRRAYSLIGAILSLVMFVSKGC